MAARLLVVTDAFKTQGPGVLLAPRFSATTPPPRGSFSVMLRLPDGTDRRATAAVEVSHVRGPHPPFAMYRLLDVAATDVPPGTEVWSVDDAP